MKQLAITFDDGPDPRYTGLLLDLLQEHHIPATFFVVASNAESNPDLIRRMLAEHHQVAMHSYNHRHAWFSSYHYMKKMCIRDRSIPSGYFSITASMASCLPSFVDKSAR